MRNGILQTKRTSTRSVRLGSMVGTSSPPTAPGPGSPSSAYEEVAPIPDHPIRSCRYTCH